MNERIKKLLKNICLILGQNITDITDNVIYGIKNYPMYGIGITNYNYVSNWWKYWLKVFGLNLLYSYLIIIINKKNLELGMIHSYIVKKLCWNYTHLHGHSKATEICHPHEHTKKPLSEILLKLLTYLCNCKSSARTTNVIFIHFLLLINLTKKFLLMRHKQITITSVKNTPYLFELPSTIAVYVCFNACLHFCKNRGRRKHAFFLCLQKLSM